MDDDRLNRRLLVWFSLGHLANDCAPCALWLIAPAIGIAMDLSPAEVGLLITITSVGAALGYLPAGVLADRVAKRGRLLLATFWWVAIGYAVASQAPGFWSVALLLAVAGLGDAAWHPIATGVLAQALPKRRAQALGIHAMGGSFAEVLAPLAVGFLLVHVDWRTALLLCALPAALMGLAFLRVSAAVPAARQGALSWSDLWSLLQAWRSLRGLGMVAMIGVSNMAFMAILAMAPLLLQRVYGLSPAETGLVFSAMVLAGALSQPLIGRLSDGTGRKPLVVAGNLAAVAACLAVAVVGDPGLGGRVRRSA
jgi:FSR family fosmidomycin resistance protein-like MFS transporter